MALYNCVSKISDKVCQNRVQCTVNNMTEFYVLIFHRRFTPILNNCFVVF